MRWRRTARKARDGQVECAPEGCRTDASLFPGRDGIVDEFGRDDLGVVVAGFGESGVRCPQNSTELASKSVRVVLEEAVYGRLRDGLIERHRSVVIGRWARTRD